METMLLLHVKKSFGGRARMRAFALRYGGIVVSDFPCAGVHTAERPCINRFLPCERPGANGKGKFFAAY